MFLKRFRKDEGGAAAVELALAAPILAGIVLTSAAIWMRSNDNQNAAAALDAGVAYYMNGGGSDEDARAFILSAWHDRPEDASVRISRQKRCGTTVTQQAACGNGNAPGEYVSMSVSANKRDAFGQTTVSGGRTVRAS